NTMTVKRLASSSMAGIGLDSLPKNADKACQQYGKSKAVYLHSANANPHLAPGTGVQNTIWKCEP
ncbi:hypothetical protein MAY55_22055, partial [Escherichia coli]